MSPIIFACCAQAIIVLLILSFKEELPIFFSDWPVFIFVNLIPLMVGAWIASKTKTWKECFLTMSFALGCTSAVLVIYGILGVAMSLFVFNK